LVDDPDGLITGQTYRVEVTFSAPMTGLISFSFGRYATAPGFNGWDWLIDGSVTTMQFANLVWNPYNLTTGVGVYAIMAKQGLTFPGYNGTITINVYSGSGC
jgi:hypothetical protein